MPAPYQRIHVVVNPASGPDRPVLSILNDVFGQHDVDWSISVTRRYGDATRQAREAIERGVDLVVGYGGDGTQHELANAVIDCGMTMGVLPGGTGNGFAREMDIPKDLRAAVEVLCTSSKVRRVDVARANNEYFIQRLYAGVAPEHQTTRQLKDRYGLLAYAITFPKQVVAAPESAYRLSIDDHVVNVTGIKCYVVNSGKMGVGLSISAGFSVDDGLLDVFVVSRKPLSIMAAETRFLRMPGWQAGLYYWQGRRITVEAQPEQAIWMDGEHQGLSPVTVEIVPGALGVVVP